MQPEITEAREIVECLLVSAGAGVLGAALLFVARRRLRPDLSEASVAVVTTTVSFVGTLFTFVLGFTIVNLWTNFTDAQKLSHTEATRIRTVWRLAKGLEDGAALRRALYDYTRSVVNEEWPAMRAGRAGPKTDACKDLVWDEALLLLKKNEQNAILAQGVLDSLVEVNDLRRERLEMLRDRLNSLLTVALALSALLTIVCFLLLKIDNPRAQAASDFTLVCIVALNFYLLHALGQPFNGRGFSVSAEPYAMLAARMLAEDGSVQATATTSR